MMNTNGFQPLNLGEFRGAHVDLALAAIDPTRASVAPRNVETTLKGLQPRNGYELLHTDTVGRVTYIYPWTARGLVSPDRLILFRSNRTLAIRYLQTNTTQELITLPAGTVTISVSEINNRIYITGRNSGGGSSSGTLVIDPNTSQIDYAFAAPFNCTLTPSTGASPGTTTVGEHKFALAYTSRSGFKAGFAPSPAGTFTPVTYTVLDGDGIVEVDLSITAPDEIETVTLLMTTVDNPDRWYEVPGSTIGVPGSLAYTYTWNVDISDDLLVANANEATTLDTWIRRSFGSTADPINVSHTFMYGDRMVYVCGSHVLISEPNAHQRITLDQHIRYLTNQNFVVGGFSIRGVLYLLGESMTEAHTDNRDVPVTWAAPMPVGGAQGIPSPNCIATTVGSDAGSSYAIILNPGGIWYFDGNYSAKPINHYSMDDWKRVNWAARDSIKVVDNPTEQKIYVAVPLDAETTPTRMMVFHYARGKNIYGIMPEAVDYYMYDLDNYRQITGLGIYTEKTSRRLSTLVAQPNDGDTNTLIYNSRGSRDTKDNTSGFNWSWRSSSLITRDNLQAGDLNSTCGFKFYAQGNMSIVGSLYVLGKTGGVERVIPFIPRVTNNPDRGVECPFITIFHNAQFELRGTTTGGGDCVFNYGKFFWKRIASVLP